MQIKVVSYMALLASLMAAVHGFALIDSFEMPGRRTWCVGSGSKCYRSDQCCTGYVCAAFDDLFGSNPEIPGYCVHEKDLKPCMSSSDCPVEDKCLLLGRTGARYCVSRPTVSVYDEVPADPSNSVYAKRERGLGQRCADDSDCSTFTKDGKDRLCCQRIRRYRQKAKRICDRITPISSCIPNRY